MNGCRSARWRDLRQAKNTPCSRCFWRFFWWRHCARKLNFDRKSFRETQVWVGVQLPSWFKAIFSHRVLFGWYPRKNPLVFAPVAVASIMAACCRPKTALGEFAKCLQQKKVPDLSMKFPMYVVSLQNVLKMTEVRCHQQLLEDGILTTMGDSGKAMLISHQWVSQQHPDPDGKQLKVFQDAMKNLLDGSTVPNYSGWAEIVALYVGRTRFATSDLSETSLFVWYDYFSIPQYTVTAQSRSVSTNLYADQRNGILSIPAYIHRCDLFVVLCPSMKHATLPTELNYHSWAERGWCRLEAMARELSVKNLSWKRAKIRTWLVSILILLFRDGICIFRPTINLDLVERLNLKLWVGKSYNIRYYKIQWNWTLQEGPFLFWMGTDCSWRQERFHPCHWGSQASYVE